MYKHKADLREENWLRTQLNEQSKQHSSTKLYDFIRNHTGRSAKNNRLQNKEIIQKLKKQHEIDVNGYGAKLVEHKKMIEHLNKTINQLNEALEVFDTEPKQENILGYFKTKVSARSWIDTQFLKGTQSHLKIIEHKENEKVKYYYVLRH